MTARIAVTPQTRDMIAQFAKGLGTTQDEALKFLLRKAIDENDPLVMGHRLRPEYNPKFAEADNDN